MPVPSTRQHVEKQQSTLKPTVLDTARDPQWLVRRLDVSLALSCRGCCYWNLTWRSPFSSLISVSYNWISSLRFFLQNDHTLFLSYVTSIIIILLEASWELITRREYRVLRREWGEGYVLELTQLNTSACGMGQGTANLERRLLNLWFCSQPHGNRSSEAVLCSREKSKLQSQAAWDEGLQSINCGSSGTVFVRK